MSKYPNTAAVASSDEPAADAPQVLMVVQDDSAINAVDAFVKNRMEVTHGFVVTVVEGDSLTAGMLSGKAFIWVTCSISADVTAAKIGTVLVNAAVNCVICDGGAAAYMGMGDVGYPGPVGGFTDIVIETPADPLAAGLSGTVTCLTISADAMSIFLTGGGVTNIAYRPGTSSQKTIFYYDSGDEMFNEDPAPAKRAGFFFARDLAGSFTSDALDLFDAMMTYITT